MKHKRKKVLNIASHMVYLEGDLFFILCGIRRSYKNVDVYPPIKGSFPFSTHAGKYIMPGQSEPNVFFYNLA